MGRVYFCDKIQHQTNKLVDFSNILYPDVIQYPTTLQTTAYSAIMKCFMVTNCKRRSNYNDSSLRLTDRATNVTYRLLRSVNGLYTVFGSKITNEGGQIIMNVCIYEKLVSDPS